MQIELDEADFEPNEVWQATWARFEKRARLGTPLIPEDFTLTLMRTFDRTNVFQLEEHVMAYTGLPKTKGVVRTHCRKT